ncbi:MAG: FG-GAP-like repeat-containing protein [Candidatus Dormibacteria bacterium]
MGAFSWSAAVLSAYVFATGAGGSTPAPAAPPTLTASWSATVHVAPGKSSPPSGISSEPFGGGTVADLFGDGRKQVVAGFPDGSVWAFDGVTGAVLPGWPQYIGGPIHSTPTVADLTGDGRDEVIATSEAGYIYVFNGDGSVFPGWPQHTDPPGPGVNPGVFGGVAVGDLFGDGHKELVAAAWDQHLWAWDRYGNVLSGFPLHVWDTAFDTPTLVDLEHHGQLDIVVGFDSSGPLYEPYPTGGVYWAFRPTGCVANSYANQSNCVIPGWPHTIDQVPWSSSAAVDLDGHNVAIYAGTGNLYSGPAGDQVHGFTGAGSSFGGWPASTGAMNIASPALGDLFGNGSRDVVEASEDGSLYAWDWTGNALAGWPAHPGVGSLESNPAIGPIGSGSSNGVWIIAGATLRAYNNAGQVALTAGPLDVGGFAAPTFADLGAGKVSVITLSQANSARTAWTVRAFPIPGTTKILPGSWTGFHGNAQLSGQMAPSATMGALSPLQATTGITLTWSLDPSSVPASSYIVWVRDQAAGGWIRYGTTNQTSMPFNGVPGHSYAFTVQAATRAATQDAGFSTNTATTTIASAALYSTPFKGLYAVSATGILDPGSSAPMYGATEWPNWDIVRGIAVAAGGAGGYTLDAFGGVHPFGTAPPVAATAYWPGWDIARGIAVRPDGQSGYVLDGLGGLHPFGVPGDMPPSVQVTAYWQGWNIARDVQLRSDGVSGYVLDGLGGVHAFGVSGDIPANAAVTAYWPGWDIAHRFALDPAGTGGYVMDGLGGPHPFGVPGSAPPQLTPQQITGYWPAWDIARGIVFVPGSSTQGWVVDYYGGFHSFAGAPPVFSPNYGGDTSVRGLSGA